MSFHDPSVIILLDQKYKYKLKLIFCFFQSATYGFKCNKLYHYNS